MNETDKNNQNNGELLQLVSFVIGTEEFGIDILLVQEINRMIDITSVPNSPDYVKGVINLRGKVIPVIELRKKLGLEKREFDKDTRIVVVDVLGKTIGFIVDSVNEVLRISKDTTEPPPEMVSGVNSKYITAVGKLEDKLLILLDLEKVLSDEETLEAA